MKSHSEGQDRLLNLKEGEQAVSLKKSLIY